MAFYRNTVKWDRFVHIVRFLHFDDNKYELDKTDENDDRLWKMIIISYEVIVLLEGTIIFRQYVPKKNKFS